jgi:hypothetical protein
VTGSRRLANVREIRHTVKRNSSFYEVIHSGLQIPSSPTECNSD